MEHSTSNVVKFVESFDADIGTRPRPRLASAQLGNSTLDEVCADTQGESRMQKLIHFNNPISVAIAAL
jgi:hypothetical protein